MSKIDISGLDKKTQEDIESVLGYPLERLYSNKDFSDFIEHSNLDRGLAHQILDVLETPMTMNQQEAIKIVKQGLKEHGNKS